MTGLASAPQAATSAPDWSDTSIAPPFATVVCIADATSAGQAARRQAAALAAGGGTVRSVVAPPSAWRNHDAVLQLADGADILVLGPGTVSETILEHMWMPVLLSRWLPVDADIADRILLVVDQSVEPDRAAETAASIATLHDGEVIILPSLARDYDLQRSMAASSRIVLEVSGAWPEVFGEEVVREAAVAAAVRDAGASLLALPLGDTTDARAAAVSMARHVTCPVLAIPSR
jgi:hypothetical protein